LIDRSIRAGKPDADRAKYEKELECPPLPMALFYLWAAYKRIRRRKGGNGFGPVPLEGSDFQAYEHRYRVRFLPFENEILDELDDLWLAAQGRKLDDPIDDPEE
jgi:hypothetical protein